MGKLFGNVKQLKVGILAGEHVVHIIAPGTDNGHVAYIGAGHEIQSKEITKKQVYNTKSNIKTAENFLKVAEKIEHEYEEALDDKKYRRMLECVRDYLVAGSRKKQQAAAEKMQSALNEYITKYSSGSQNLDYVKKVEFAKSLRKTYKESMNGDLVTDELSNQIKGYVEAKDIDNPSFSGISGFFSGWRKVYDRPLFPHEPDPTDIVQGIGLEDCYMQASLLKIAQTDPEKIKKAMKDNGDGTVTVRFYEDIVNPENGEKKRQPVFIRVEKSESKILGFGKASYASGSLWVQMMEKAYAKYNDRQKIREGKKAKGLSGISRSNASYFLNAFEEKADYQSGVLGSYNENYFTVNDINSNKKLLEYQKAYCEKLFEFLSKHKDDTIIVGSDFQSKSQNKVIKNLGIRTGHAYAITDVFESDGEKYVQVRDPYGVFSSKYENGKLKKAGKVVSNYSKSGSDTMGTFNLKIKDFANIFTNFTGIKEEHLAEYNDSISAGVDPLHKEYVEGLNKVKVSEDNVKDINKKVNDDWEIFGNDEKSDDKVDVEDGFEMVDNLPIADEPKLKTGEYGVIQNAMAYYYNQLLNVQSKRRNSDQFNELRNAVEDFSKIDKDAPKDPSIKYTLYLNKLKEIDKLIDNYVTYKNGKYSEISQHKLEVSLQLKNYVNKKFNYMKENPKEYKVSDNQCKKDHQGEPTSFNKEVKSNNKNIEVNSKKVLDRFNEKQIKKMEEIVQSKFEKN